MQHHDTPEEKEHRRNKYWCLVNIGKCTRCEALVFRDWTDEKVRMIINKECKPIPKWSNKQWEK